MIKFDKPTNLNGSELRAELNAAGVKISDADDSVLLAADGYLYLDIKSADESKAAPIVVAHNGKTVLSEPSIQDKLAQVGLSIQELKTALLA